ncbi:Cyclic nucleotide-binding protein [Pseudocohnilembus persalinus]|uniref:Cyclic nucleotide-binding protein n=1 Tax=Pseudocohnilembus persalinus TaxID=266149 RepID=A0A0V0QX03_PSEPJ|nr:Cyclic nucleotide-binding protein [Pseudocohnilembus persalinus]|eukprot:KRX06770.1 Cyclic nucleotide-binding protein [Pseudocohnilembus persalinus]
MNQDNNLSLEEQIEKQALKGAFENLASPDTHLISIKQIQYILSDDFQKKEDFDILKENGLILEALQQFLQEGQDVDFDQFYNVMVQKINPYKNESDLEKIFNLFSEPGLNDQNTITFQSLKRVTQELNQIMSQDDLQEIIDKLSHIVNGNGKELTFYNFKKLFEHQHSKFSEQTQSNIQQSQLQQFEISNLNTEEGNQNLQNFSNVYLNSQNSQRPMIVNQNKKIKFIKNDNNISQSIRQQGEQYLQNEDKNTQFKQQQFLIHHLISDKTNVQQDEVNLKELSGWEKVIYFFSEYLPIIRPNSYTANLWHTIIFLAICFKIFEIPVVLAFDLQHEVSLYYQIPVLLIFLFEMVISFNLGVFQQGQVVMERKIIRKNYLNILVFFVAHILACGFFFIAMITTKIDPEKQTWVIKNEYQDMPASTQYVNSLYFSFISMSTIGYGDISPQTTSERIYIMIISIISCGVFGYSLNILTQIFSEITDKNQEFRKYKLIVLRYMNQRGIEPDLQIRVLKSLEYTFSRDNEQISIQKTPEVFNRISKQLIDEVKSDFYVRILTNHQIFKTNFSTQFLSKLAMVIHEQTYTPERFQQLQEQLQLENVNSLAKKYEECSLCYNTGHKLQVCPYMHLHIDQNWLFYKYIHKNNKTIKHERQTSDDENSGNQHSDSSYQIYKSNKKQAQFLRFNDDTDFIIQNEKNKTQIPRYVDRNQRKTMIGDQFMEQFLNFKENQEIKSEDLWIEFDQAKIYSKYHPTYNYDKVIERYNDWRFLQHARKQWKLAVQKKNQKPQNKQKQDHKVTKGLLDQFLVQIKEQQSVEIDLNLQFK